MKVFIPHYSNEVEKRVLRGPITLKKPEPYNHKKFCEDAEYANQYQYEVDVYNNHIRMLPTTAMPDMTPEFGKREEVVEGRDFELQWEIYDSGIGRWLKETALTQDPFNNAQRREVAIAIEGKPDREKSPKPADAQCGDECRIDEQYEKEIVAGAVLCGGCGRRRPGTKYVLASSITPDRKRGATISTGDDYGARILERNQFYYKTLLKIKDIQEEEMYLTKSPLEMLTMINQIVDDAIIGASPSTTQSVEQPVGEQAFEKYPDLAKIIAWFANHVHVPGRDWSRLLHEINKAVASTAPASSVEERAKEALIKIKEIATENTINCIHCDSIRGIARAALAGHSSQQTGDAVEFARWIVESTHFKPTGKVDEWTALHMDDGWVTLSTAQLFELFIERNGEPYC